MKTIKLTRGKVALVDDSDFEELSKFKWAANKSHRQWRAQRSASVAEIAAGLPSKILMHRQIMGFPDFEVDHRNRDSLDNQRHNLRPATHSQQMANSRMRDHGRYRGVRKHWHRFVCRIRQDNKEHHIGSFESAEQAAKAYDREAIKRFGGFAVLNFPEEFFEEIGGVS